MKQRITLTIDPETLREFDRLKTTKRQGRSGHVEELMTTAIHYSKVADAALAQPMKQPRKRK